MCVRSRGRVMLDCKGRAERQLIRRQTPVRQAHHSGMTGRAAALKIGDHSMLQISGARSRFSVASYEPRSVGREVEPWSMPLATGKERDKD